MEHQAESTLVELIRYNNWANAQILAACQRRHRTGIDAGAMRCGIDAACEPRDDNEFGLAEFVRDLAGEFRASRGRVARTDDCNHRQFQGVDPATHRNQRRSIVDHP